MLIFLLKYHIKLLPITLTNKNPKTYEAFPAGDAFLAMLLAEFFMLAAILILI